MLGGRESGFAHIVRRYQVEVARIVHALLLDRAASEDLVQEIFVKAFEHLRQYRMGEGFGKWIRGIARNTVRQELRRRSRESARMTAYAAMVESRMQDSNLEELVQKERLKTLRDCVERLDHQAAELVRRRYSLSESFEEIARTLGEAGGAIRTRLYRIRGRLQQCLEAKGVNS